MKAMLHLVARLFSGVGYAVFISFFLLAGLAESSAQSMAHGTAMRLPVDPDPLLVVTDQGEVAFEVEIADEPGERQRGLMFRQSMPDNRGVLFVFPDERRQGFWMQNTPMALDLVFVGADGQVRAIAPGIPFSTASISPNVKSQFVLELKSGTAQNTGIEVGDQVHHPRLTSTVAK